MYMNFLAQSLTQSISSTVNRRGTFVFFFKRTIKSRETEKKFYNHYNVPCRLMLGHKREQYRLGSCPQGAKFG